MRTTAEIAAEARQLLETSNTKFVPPSLVRIGELSVEHMEASAAETAELRGELADAKKALAANDEAFLQLGQAVTHVQSDLEALKAPTA